MDKNRTVTQPGFIRRAGMWLRQSPDLAKAVFRSDPRRAGIVSVSLVTGLLLITGGITASVPSNKDSSTGRNIAEQVASSLFPNSHAKTGTTPQTAQPADNPATAATAATTTSLVAPPLLGPSGATPSTAPPGSAPTSSAPPLGVSGPGVVTLGKQGLSLAINASKSNVAPGEKVVFSASINDPNGGVLGLQWDFGDGITVNADPKSCSDTANQPTVNEGRADFDTSTAHAYRQPGNYTVRVTARTGSRCGTKANTDTVVATGMVKVTGEASMNGPGNPNADVTIASGGTSNDPHLGLRVKGSDSDGFISKIVIDWQDGSAPQNVINYPLSGCIDPGADWPSSTRDESPEHTYENAGSHNVTVTITSTGCDGSQSQQAIGVLNGVTVGGTMQSSSTTPPASAAATENP